MTAGERRGDCGICSGNIRGSECKRLDNNDPRLTPEQLCILGLSETLERNRLNGADIYMSHAWDCVEHALSSDAPLYTRNNHKLLNEAFSTANNILRNHNQHNLNEVLEAIAFRNYEELYRSLAERRPITLDQVYTARQNVGALITTIDDNPDFPKEYDDSVRGFMSEQTVQWLSLNNALVYENSEMIIYPTSPREGHSRHLRAFNHDGYQITNNGRVRIETKRSHAAHRKRRSYDKSIVYVVLQDILDNTRSKCGGKVGSPRDNFLIGAIRDTANGRETRSKEYVLQTAGYFLQKHIEENNPLAA